MSAFLSEISDQLNLRWAWDKVKREASPGDIWFDEIELADFDLKLEQNLQGIADQLGSSSYQLSPLRPLPFPKQPKEGEPRVRQTFCVPIRDQVAWTAVVNVVGPFVDSKMPPWSYGNRLFRKIWVEEDDDGVKRRRVGHYRNSSGKLYLSFGQSWPVFRRHVYLTTRAMLRSKVNLPELDERTKEEEELQASLTSDNRCPFIDRNYWNDRRPRSSELDLYRCSVDLENFYPELRLSTVKANIVEALPSDWKSDAESALSALLSFNIDPSGWTDEELTAMSLPQPVGPYDRIPTGLFVAGFLANAGLLKVDNEVQARLNNSNVAHFRFVDDHVVLGYSIDDVVSWVNTYEELLTRADTGVKINKSKTEPEALADYFKDSSIGLDKAKNECKLDKQFPSPLMTKTLELVSGIAKADFNLLDSNELATLSDQLEHLLLVDLGDDEIPAKTRLSFAATRLTRVAECRLANDETRATLRCEVEHLESEIEKKKKKKVGTGNANAGAVSSLRHRLESVKSELHLQEARIESETHRAFQLLRKALRERPDRVRLWTRAVLMCRLTGVHGLSDLLKDISSLRKRFKGTANALAADYLLTNLLGLIAGQSLTAATLVAGQGVPAWKVEAASRFLDNVQSVANQIRSALPKKHPWYMTGSLKLYKFSAYCGRELLRVAGTKPKLSKQGLHVVAEGKAHLEIIAGSGDDAVWAWWAARSTTRDLKPRASLLAKTLGEKLETTTSAVSYWQFFPLDAPANILNFMLGNSSKFKTVSDGWWFDALRANQEIRSELPHLRATGKARRVQSVLSLKKGRKVSLYEWCAFLRKIATKDSSDPRLGEWTALEFVRQVGELVDDSPILDAAYLQSIKEESAPTICVHPANFRVPAEWLNEGFALSWDSWRKMVRPPEKSITLTLCSKKHHIQDERYTPINDAALLFKSVNAVRGLGLLLYGLLKRSFELPTLWNGPGHADILSLLPKLLLADVTCSTWTLGLLQGCLQANALENILIQRRGAVGWHIDSDMEFDPISFLDAKSVTMTVKKCQAALERHQFSTLDSRARQLTPITVRQLTSPDWSRDFSNTHPSGDECE